MTKGIFITATGTDIGKTYVSGLLVKKMRELGHNCGYFKPVLSGAEEINGLIIPGDSNYVLNYAQIEGNPIDFTSYVFKNAVSPHLASIIENNPIKLDKIKNDFKKINNYFDYIVVEGAGGIICPLNIDDNIILIDLIKNLNLTTIIVADAGLGTINSTVLTCEYAKQKNINIKGIILNNYDYNNVMHRDNKKQIEKLTKINVITTVSYNDDNILINDIENIFEEMI